MILSYLAASLTVPAEPRTMLQEQSNISETVGLKINLQKTKIMSICNMRLTIEKLYLLWREEYIYLGHNIKIGKNSLVHSGGLAIYFANKKSQ